MIDANQHHLFEVTYKTHHSYMPGGKGIVSEPRTCWLTVHTPNVLDVQEAIKASEGCQCSGVYIIRCDWRGILKISADDVRLRRAEAEG